MGKSWSPCRNVLVEKELSEEPPGLCRAADTQAELK